MLGFAVCTARRHGVFFLELIRIDLNPFKSNWGQRCDGGGGGRQLGLEERRDVISGENGI